MKLIGMYKFEGVMRCKSGLHIGGNNNLIKIGGVDSEVVKHPVTDEPYVPGSSLKGKMRSQLERIGNKVTDRGEPCGCGSKDCMVCLLFGAHKNTRSSAAPTRLLVRDMFLTDEKRKEYQELLVEKGVSYLENKAENMINRNSGTAENPRFIERVPAGAEFGFELQLQVFEGDPIEKMLAAVKQGLSEVEATYIGGSGSRGSGQVKFDYSENYRKIGG